MHGYDAAAREALYRALAGLAALIARQGAFVIVATAAPSREQLRLARTLAPSFVEVFVDTPLEECVRRDVTGLYAAAHRNVTCEHDVVAMLRDLLAQRLAYAAHDGDDLFDATQNARVVAGDEHYHRAQCTTALRSHGTCAISTCSTPCIRSCAHRDHTKLVVGAHNAHVGDAGATEMAVRGEHNFGQLCRGEFADDVFIVGFGTDHGTVADAHAWDEPMQRMRVRPARADSYERLCHDSRVPAFLLPLRDPGHSSLRDGRAAPRLDRCGVPARSRAGKSLLSGHLPGPVRRVRWFDETQAVQPLTASSILLPSSAHLFAS